MPALLDHPQVPHEITVRGERCSLFWEHDGHDWIVFCNYSKAQAPIYGFGSDKQAAFNDLLEAFRSLFDFVSDCYTKEWEKIYC